MHTKLPFATALFLVLGPSAVCLLFGIVYHFLSARRVSKELEAPPTNVTQVSPRRDDYQSVLLIFGVIALAIAMSASAL